jgi:hypothetical protein
MMSEFSLKLQLANAESRESELREYIQILLDDNERLSKELVKMAKDVENG